MFLTIGIKTVAIMMPFPDVFKVFDSHSRDLLGRPSASGYCVLISVEGIENLVWYFMLTSRSSETTIILPFELKGVKCIIDDIGRKLYRNDIAKSDITDSTI